MKARPGRVVRAARACAARACVGRLVAALLTGTALLPVACASVEKAAAKDPMRCERDPSCSKARDAYSDCSKQCVDDPECTDRCRGMQQDRNGHP